MNLIVFGISFIFLLTAWNFMIKRTVVDATRDKLFDLRDDVRQEFKERGWDMTSDTYKSLRDLMNGYLRFTEDYSFWKLLYLTSKIRNNLNFQKIIRERIENQFQNIDVEQAEFVRSVREKSSQAILQFAVHRSGMLLLLAISITPFVFILKFISQCTRSVDSLMDLFYRSARRLDAIIIILFSSSAKLIYDLIFRAEFFEIYSLRIWSEQRKIAFPS